VPAAASSVGIQSIVIITCSEPDPVDPPWPAHDRRNAEAAFEQFLLHAGERPSIGKPLAAVVAGEDDDGIVCETACVERLQHSTDIDVQALHHGGVGLLRAAVPVKEVPDPLRLSLVIRPPTANAVR
jgi:hypothetical protein